MSINFPSNPALDDLFTDSSNVEWRCIDATVGDVQWARTGFSPPQNYMGKNYIINPTFSVNQRGFAGGNLNVGVYGFDRWKAFNASATMDVVDGVATIVGDIGQVIEDFGYVGPMTLSWKGTATAQGSGATSPLTFNKIAGITAVEFSDGTLSEVKLEIGSVATPFEYPDIGTELVKCQRYFERLTVGNANGVFSSGVIASSTIADTTVAYTTKRALPTWTSSGAFKAGTVGDFGGTLELFNGGVNAVTGRLTSSGMTAGYGARLQANNDIDAYIDISAEL